MAFITRTIGNILRSRRSLASPFAILFLIIVGVFLTKEKRNLINRHILVSRFPTQVIPFDQELPEIDVLIAAAPKELNFINLVIEAVVKNSLNPISTVFVIVPELSKSAFAEILVLGQLEDVTIVLKGEEEVLGANLRAGIERRFGARAGWAKAEFIKLLSICNSEKSGVLVVDADTLILSPHAWMDRHGHQVISPVQEYHEVYFKLYKYLGLPMEYEHLSFMSHYLLFQPTIYRAAFESVAKSDPNSLLRQISEFVPKTENSPFCICYEMYTHFLLAEHPDLAYFEKWANRAYKREYVLDLMELPNIVKKYGRYSSISCHQYLS